MPSPVTSEDFEIQQFSGNVCESIRKLLEVNDTLKEFFAWMFNSDGTLTSAFKLLMQDVAVAPGNIIFRPVSSIPDGYLMCNGQAVSRTEYANLFAVIGTQFGTGDGSTTFNLPNLREKFLFGGGTGSTHPVGETGGSETVTLTLAQIPSHQHDAWAGAVRWNFAGITGNAGSYADVQGSNVTDIKTVAAGGGAAHDNMPPYFTGIWLIKT